MNILSLLAVFLFINSPNLLAVKAGNFEDPRRNIDRFEDAKNQSFALLIKSSNFDPKGPRTNQFRTIFQNSEFTNQRDKIIYRAHSKSGLEILFYAEKHGDAITVDFEFDGKYFHSLIFGHAVFFFLHEKGWERRQVKFNDISFPWDEIVEAAQTFVPQTGHRRINSSH